MNNRDNQIMNNKSTVPISVVMSVYNYPKYPVRGIESTLAQSFHDFEFIIIDDGSDKKSNEILRKYVCLDKRIKLFVNEKNLKLGTSLNRGISEAKGAYIARADSNIDYHPDRLKLQLNFLEQNKQIDVVGSNFYWATEGKAEHHLIKLPQMHEDIVKQLSKGNCLCHPSVMFRKESLIPFGPYKEGFGKAQDYYLWMKARNKIKFYNMQESLLTKWHRKNMRNNRLIEYFINDLKIRILGIRTSPNPLVDIFYLPRSINYFLQL